jgi:hypothetical protein
MNIITNPTNDPIRDALAEARDTMTLALADAAQAAARVPRELPEPVEADARNRLIERANSQLVDRLIVPGGTVAGSDGVPAAVTPATDHVVGEMVPAQGVVWHFFEDENGDTHIVAEEV